MVCSRVLGGQPDQSRRPTRSDGGTFTLVDGKYIRTAVPSATRTIPRRRRDKFGFARVLQQGVLELRSAGDLET